MTCWAPCQLVNQGYFLSYFSPFFRHCRVCFLLAIAGVNTELLMNVLNDLDELINKKQREKIKKMRVDFQIGSFTTQTAIYVQLELKSLKI